MSNTNSGLYDGVQASNNQRRPRQLSVAEILAELDTLQTKGKEELTVAGPSSSTSQLPQSLVNELKMQRQEGEPLLESAKTLLELFGEYGVDPWLSPFFEEAVRQIQAEHGNRSNSAEFFMNDQPVDGNQKTSLTGTPHTGDALSEVSSLKGSILNSDRLDPTQQLPPDDFFDPLGFVESLRDYISLTAQHPKESFAKTDTAFLLSQSAAKELYAHSTLPASVDDIKDSDHPLWNMARAIWNTGRSPDTTDDAGVTLTGMAMMANSWGDNQGPYYDTGWRSLCPPIIISDCPGYDPSEVDKSIGKYSICHWIVCTTGVHADGRIATYIPPNEEYDMFEPSYTQLFMVDTVNWAVRSQRLSQLLKREGELDDDLAAQLQEQRILEESLAQRKWDKTVSLIHTSALHKEKFLDPPNIRHYSQGAIINPGTSMQAAIMFCNANDYHKKTKFIHPRFTGTVLSTLQVKATLHSTDQGETTTQKILHVVVSAENDMGKHGANDSHMTQQFARKLMYRMGHAVRCAIRNDEEEVLMGLEEEESTLATSHYLHKNLAYAIERTVDLEKKEKDVEMRVARVASGSGQAIDDPRPYTFSVKHNFDRYGEEDLGQGADSLEFLLWLPEAEVSTD